MRRFSLGALIWLFAGIWHANADSLDQIYARGEALGRAGDFAAAAPLIRQAADGGHAQAQYTLGTLYSFGDGVPQSKAEARLWFEKAAAQDHAGALYNLGLYYDRGISVTQDRPRALAYYKRGAGAGDTRAAYNAGQMLVTGDGVTADPAEGVGYLELAAAQDIPKANASLGFIYQTGLGVRRNAELALDHYARAESKGMDVAGERRLMLASTVLEEGLALERDRYGAEALRSFDLACRFGQFFACYNAGRVRMAGDIVAKDMTSAVVSFRAACRWDNAPGCRGLADAVMQGARATPDDVSRTAKLATELCNKGESRGCHNLAVMKLQPRFNMRDPQGAMNLFAQSCLKKGFQPSCQPYFDMYNASLAKPQGGGSSGMTWLEQGIIDVLGVVAGTMSAMGSAGQYSTGAYSGYSPAAPASVVTTGGYSPQDRADFNQFIASVSSYGQHVSCRPGNPYC